MQDSYRAAAAGHVHGHPEPDARRPGPGAGLQAVWIPRAAGLLGRQGEKSLSCLVLYTSEGWASLVRYRQGQRKAQKFALGLSPHRRTR